MRFIKFILVALIVCALCGCQTMSYQINVTDAEGGVTDIYATKHLMPWTELKGNEINLMTGVDADGNWYVATGEQIESLIQNPEIAKAIVDGAVSAVAEAFKAGAFIP